MLKGSKEGGGCIIKETNIGSNRRQKIKKDVQCTACCSKTPHLGTKNLGNGLKTVT